MWPWCGYSLLQSEGLALHFAFLCQQLIAILSSSDENQPNMESRALTGQWGIGQAADLSLLLWQMANKSDPAY